MGGAELIMEKLDVLIRLAKARLAGQNLDPASIPEYRQDEKLKAFEKLIASKVAPETWSSIFLLNRKVWLKGGPALTATVLTETKRLVLTIRPVDGGFEMDGPAGVVRLADDEQFNDRLLVGVGEALDAAPHY
jgi:hypothetical protein